MLGVEASSLAGAVVSLVVWRGLEDVPVTESIVITSYFNELLFGCGL